MIASLLKKISGDWYNEYIYFKYCIHQKPFFVRQAARILLLPWAFGVRCQRRLRKRLDIPCVEMVVTMPCHSSCKDCREVNSSHSHPVDLETGRLVKDMDEFLFHVDRVYRLMVIGVEPFSHSNLSAFLTYLLGQDKIKLIDIFTPGSVLPDPEMLRLLAHRKIFVTISSYPMEDSPVKPRFISALEENGINYLVKNTWRDLGSFNPVADGRLTAVKHRFARCVSRRLLLSDGECHLCPRSAHGRRLGQFLPNPSDQVAFRDRKDPSAFKKEFKQMLHKRYLAACRRCLGSHPTSKMRDLLWTLSGRWYNEYIYYKYRIHHISPLGQDILRCFFLPFAVVMKLKAALRNQLEIAHIEMPITTRCTLRCQDCGNLIPFYRQPADFDADQLIRDVDDFLYHVDRVHRFIVLGGETFLHRELPRVLSHLIQQRKIGLLHLFTNGSVIPGANVLTLLKHRKIIVSVSSMPEAVSPHKTRFIAFLKKNRINYKIEDRLWRDLGGFHPDVDNRPDALMRRFAQCSMKGLHNLSNGEYHACPRSFHGERLGQFVPDATDKVVIRNRRDRDAFRREREALLRKKYLAACRSCTGAPEESVYPGIQMAGDAGNIAGKNEGPL